jgi:hypothetical protein
MNIENLTQNEALLILDGLGKYKQQLEYIMSSKELPPEHHSAYNNSISMLIPLISKVEDQVAYQIAINEVKQYTKIVSLSGPVGGYR